MCVIYSDSKAIQDTWEPWLQNQQAGNATGIASLIRSRPRAVTDFTLGLPNLFHLLHQLHVDYGIQAYVSLRFGCK